MSQVIPVPVALISGLILLLVGVEVGAPPAATAVGAISGGLAIGIAWAQSDRFPNGGGPL